MKKIIFFLLLFMVLQKSTVDCMEKTQSFNLDKTLNKLYALLYGTISSSPENKEILWLNMQKAMGIIENNNLVVAIPLDKQGRTVLHFAAEYSDDLLCVWLKKYSDNCALLKKHSDKELIDNDGNTLLHKASQSGNSISICLLYLFGVPINKKNKYGLTPLHYAVMSKEPEAVRKLLFFGADPNEADENGDTPLHYSIDIWDSQYAQLLLRGGANSFICNHNNQTVIDCLITKYEDQLRKQEAYKQDKSSQEVIDYLIKKYEVQQKAYKQDENSLLISYAKFEELKTKSKECCALFSSIDTSGRCKKLLEDGYKNFEITRRVAPNNLLVSKNK